LTGFGRRFKESGIIKKIGSTLTLVEKPSEF